MNKYDISMDDFSLDEIESIELMGEEDTIDITVEDTHMFYANDIYTHNSSLTAETVDSSMFGGSIKKAQIGHFIISIAKTLDQKEHGTANMAILKSRFGQDGIIFEDIIFDNGRIQISINKGQEDGHSFLQSKQNRAVKDQNRVSNIMAAIQERKELEG